MNNEGWTLVPVSALLRWRDAFHTELVEWDIDPPLHHVKSSYDEICALLAAPTPPAQQCRADGRCQYAIDSGAEGDGHCPPGKCVMPAQQDDDEALEVLRLALYALMESVDLVQHDYNTDWRHGIPTRAGQLKASLYALNAHKDAIERIRALLTKRGAA